jgi:hypothetical protein
MARRIGNSEQQQPKAQPPAGGVYVVVRPISYGKPEVRHEAGAEVSDLPARSIPWLLEQGHIRLKGGE